MPSFITNVTADYDDISNVIDYEHVICGQFNRLQLLKKCK